MAKEKSAWDDIPSLDGLEVDWEFKPENPLGKRAWVRLTQDDLLSLLGVQTIAVKLVAKNFDGQGPLVDLAQSGLAVILKTQLVANQQAKVGFFLGKEKIVSRAIIRNVREEGDRFRTGVEFVDLKEEKKSFIASLISSKVFKST